MLIDILQQLAPVTGYSLSDVDGKKYLIDVLVNPAARELYNTYELCNVFYEEVFKVDPNTQVISLPYYVGKVIAIRSTDTQRPIQLVDVRVRYQNVPIGYPDISSTWREKRLKAPLHTVTDNNGKLTFKVLKPSEIDLTITVTGRTLESANLSEDVIIKKGEYSATTQNAFILSDIESIRKNNYNDLDVYIYDISGNEISVIPNCLLSPSYTILNVRNEYAVINNSVSDYVEVLFKKAFIPFRRDTDSFVAGDIYDDAIYWKAMEIYYTKRQGEDSIILADAAYKKCADLVNRIAEEYNTGKLRPLPFGDNPIMRVYERNLI